MKRVQHAGGLRGSRTWGLLVWTTLLKIDKSSIWFWPTACELANCIWLWVANANAHATAMASRSSSNNNNKGNECSNYNTRSTTKGTKGRKKANGRGGPGVWQGVVKEQKLVHDMTST